MKKKWFVFYTKSRQEKKTNELLLKKGLDPFLPLQQVMRQWTDRKKKVTVPLFNSYIFVFIEEHRIPDVLQIPGIAWNVRHNGKPAVLHLAELNTIQRFVQTGWLIEARSDFAKIELGDVVKVLDGPLKGTIGRLTEFHNKHQFSVVLESIGQVITAQIDKQAVRKLTDKEMNMSIYGS
jgi:transcription termination/antitermination protein NusG